MRSIPIKISYYDAKKGRTEMRRVQGYQTTAPGLVITRYRAGWDITHKASGVALNCIFGRLSDAHLAASEIAGMTDWEADERAIRDALKDGKILTVCAGIRDGAKPERTPHA